MASATNKFRRLWRKIRSTRVSITFTTVDKEAKETPSSGKLTAGDHENGIANSIPISDFSSEEDFIQIEASDLGSPSLDSDKRTTQVLPQPKQPNALDQKVDTNGGREDSSNLNSDRLQLITDHQRNGDEPSASIEARYLLHDNPSTSGSSSLSPFDVKDKASRGSKAENEEIAVQATAEESYMIKSEVSHEATESVLEHKNDFQTDDGRNCLSFSSQSHLCQAINEAETYDPGRIPLHVFSRHRNSMDVEWSVASNESMFSIQVGSSSFSRDHVFNFGKSGELNGLISGHGHGITPETDTAPGDKSPDICSDQSAAPAAIMQETIHEDFEPEKASPVREHEPEHALPTPQHAVAVERGNIPTTLAVPRTNSMSRPSDSSGASTHSFAFPILRAGSKNASVKVQDESPSSPPPAFPQVKPVKHRRCWSFFQCSCPSCC
ncbi:unnamed protein product [Victoria cruziana]